MAGLHRHAQFRQLHLHLGHVGEYALGDGGEVLVLQLLALGGLGAEEGTAAVNQVGPGVVEILVDQEVLLLRADGGVNALGAAVAEQPQDAQRLTAEGLHRAEEWGLLVERLAGPAQEGGGDDQGGAVGMLDDVRGACRVPGGVAAGLKRRPQPAGREAGGIRLTLDQLAAAELRDGAAALAVGQEAVVLLGGDAGHGLELVREMGRAVLDRPVLHGDRNGVGDAGVERSALPDRLLERLEDRLGQPRPLHLLVEDVHAEQVLDMGFLEIYPVQLVLRTSDAADRLLANGCHVHTPWKKKALRIRPADTRSGPAARVGIIPTRPAAVKRRRHVLRLRA